MAEVDFMLNIDLEGLVIRMQDKRPSFEVMTQMTQGPHNSIELFIVGVVVDSGPIQFLTKIGNRSSKLDQNSSYPHSTCFTL